MSAKCQGVTVVCGQEREKEFVRAQLKQLVSTYPAYREGLPEDVKDFVCSVLSCEPEGVKVRFATEPSPPCGLPASCSVTDEVELAAASMAIPHRFQEKAASSSPTHVVTA